MAIRITSDPLASPEVAVPAAEAVRKAHAVGLIERSPEFPELTYAEVRAAAARVRAAGIAVRAAGALERRDPPPPAEMAALLREVDARLEDSPLPETEWPRLTAILDRDDLARLLNISMSSLVRYERGERGTPDAVAARLHFLALVVGYSAGAYNEIGIRRWFDWPASSTAGPRPRGESKVCQSERSPAHSRYAIFGYGQPVSGRCQAHAAGGRTESDRARQPSQHDAIGDREVGKRRGVATPRHPRAHR